MTPTCEMLLAALAVACQCQAVAERAIEEYPNSGILWPDGSLEKWRETVDEMEHYRIEYVRKLATRFLADLPDDAPALADWQRLASITEAGWPPRARGFGICARAAGAPRAAAPSALGLRGQRGVRHWLSTI